MIDLGVYVGTLEGKPVAVFGLGLSGVAAVRALTAAGATVHAWDDDAQKRAAASEAGAIIDTLEDLRGHAFLLLSPGVPLHFPVPHDVVARAREADVEIIGDMALLHRAGHGLRTIGITGTNGKSTTTALVGHILTHAGMRVAVGGNIGTAVMDMDLAGKEAIVLELSSFQLDLCAEFAPDIAVHLNLTPDHIDRHGDIDGYKSAKMKIFSGPGVAIIGGDDAPSRAMEVQIRKDGSRNPVFTIATTRAVGSGVYVSDAKLHDMMEEGVAEGDAALTTDLRNLTTLPGVHNHQNIAAAWAVCRRMGIKPATIVAGLQTYPGLPHRMYTVRTINGVAYINDSKATNADAAGKALACYRNISWILGGLPKAGGLDGLDPYAGRIARAFVIGTAAEDFAAWLRRHGIAVEECGTLDVAVSAAHRFAQAGRGQPGGAGVVLLSPACASYDQFRSFEHRGQCFTDLVMVLPDGTEVAAE